MKVLFVLGDPSSINSFLFILKILYGNSPEVLINFSKAGLSISQSWNEKLTERGKYFFFIDSSQFTKITCHGHSISALLNVKEILAKLKSYKRELQEIFISVSNEDKESVYEDFCLIEVIATLHNFGSIIYRTGCKLDMKPKEFIPAAYCEYTQSDKVLLFSVDPQKLEFLQDFRNDFIEIILESQKVELYGLLNQKKICINAFTCFDEYNYGKKVYYVCNSGIDTFIRIYGEIYSLIIPPNQLQRYREVCSKWKKNMRIYVGKPKAEDGTLKFYCTAKMEKSVFIIKIQLKVTETMIISQSRSNPLPAGSNIRPLMEHNSAANDYPDMVTNSILRKNSAEINKVHSQHSILNVPNHSGIPAEEIFNSFGARLVQSQQKRSKGNPFQFSQEIGQKKVKKDGDNLSRDKSFLRISLSKIDVNLVKERSILNSKNIDERLQSQEETREYEVVEKQEGVNGRQNENILTGGLLGQMKERSSGTKAEETAINILKTNEKLFQNKSLKLHGLLGDSSGGRDYNKSHVFNFKGKKANDDISMMDLQNPFQADRINQAFSRNLSNVLENMKL